MKGPPNNKILPFGVREPARGPAEPRLEAIADVCMESPPQCREEVRRFFSQLIGLRESPTAAEFGQDLCFVSERNRLHIRITADALPSPYRRRAAIRVPSLAIMTELLISERVTYWLERGLSYSDRRLLVLDPARNLIELRQETLL